MKEVDCPYRAIMGISCSHRYAEKETRGKRKRGICRYRKDPSKCELYKLWKEELDKSSESFLNKEYIKLI